MDSWNGAGMQSYGDESRPLSALSLPSRIVIGVAACAIAVIVAIHLAMMFLHVAPSNTLSKQQGALISDYVYPEYEQNWKLFAPNPSSRTSRSRSVHSCAPRTAPCGPPAGPV